MIGGGGCLNFLGFLSLFSSQLAWCMCVLNTMVMEQCLSVFCLARTFLLWGGLFLSQGSWPGMVSKFVSNTTLRVKYYFTMYHWSIL
jgi:hypothetical protein